MTHERIPAPFTSAQRHQDRVDGMRLLTVENLARHIRRSADRWVDADVQCRSGFVSRNREPNRFPPFPRDLGQAGCLDDMQDPDLSVRIEQHRGEANERLDFRRFLDRDQDLAIHLHFPMSGNRARSSWRISTYGTPRNGSGGFTIAPLTRFWRNAIERLVAVATRGICTSTASGARSGSTEEADGAA